MPVTVLYAPGRGSDLHGTAFSNQWRRAGDPFAQLAGGPPPLVEAHLAFTVTVLRETLLNPARTPLFQVGFAREASSTNLLDPGDPRAFQLLLNPTLSAAPPATALLRINDLALHAASAVSSDSKPGRGLQEARITEPCTAGYHETDLGFLGSLAQRLLRPVAWNGSWREGIDADGLQEPVPLPGGAVLTAERAREHRFTPLFVFGWRSGETPHLAVPGNPVNDWTNADARELYAEVVARFAATYRPPFLFLGNESDAYFAHDPADYARWIGAYEEAYAAVKAASPETLVGPVFQFEETAGLGELSGETDPRWGALEAHDLSTVDVVGVSLYPWFRSERAADVPASHLAPLFERLGDVPVLVTETGWPAEEHPEQPTPWHESEAEQVAYVERLFRMIEGHDVRGAVWVFLHPLLEDDTLVGRLFGTISLRDEEGEKRPVYVAWAAK